MREEAEPAPTHRNSFSKKFRADPPVSSLYCFQLPAEASGTSRGRSQRSSLANRTKFRGWEKKIDNNIMIIRRSLYAKLKRGRGHAVRRGKWQRRVGRSPRSNSVFSQAEKVRPASLPAHGEERRANTRDRDIVQSDDFANVVVGVNRLDTDAVALTSHRRAAGCNSGNGFTAISKLTIET